MFQILSCDRSRFVHLYHLLHNYTCAEILRCLFHGIIAMIGHLSSLIKNAQRKAIYHFTLRKSHWKATYEFI